MAEKVINYKCPACTGPLRYDGKTGKLVCDYCGTTYDIAEFEAQSAASAAAGTGESAGENLKVYLCPDCGAELICEESTAASCCPYCGNAAVMPSQLQGEWKPEFIIPFKVSREEALEALRSHYKQKKLLPRAFSEENHIQKIQGVYIPFWLYEGEVCADLDYKATRSHSRRQGNYQVTTTEHFLLHRRGTVELTGVPADASRTTPDAHMDSIEPFDYSAMVPFSMSYLPGFLANRFDVSEEECRKRIIPRAEATVRSEMRDTCVGYETVTAAGGTVNTDGLKARFALLPVWLLSTRWKDENFLFAMNGQTGKLVGDLPVDKGLYWKQFALTAAGVAAAIMSAALWR